jgi:hypothetical protein
MWYKAGTLQICCSSCTQKKSTPATTMTEARWNAAHEGFKQRTSGAWECEECREKRLSREKKRHTPKQPARTEAPASS